METPELDTAVFEQLWNQRWEEGRANRQQTWDAGAADWDRKLRREGVRKTQGEARVRDTVAYLRQRGVLGADTDTADIGCGPGRFTAAFAREGRSALGVDISPAMAEYGRRYAREQGLGNVCFQALDFQAADVDALGWRERFDLVFSSITPAVRGLRGLENLMAMSRGWCFNACFVHEENQLDARIAREVFGREYRGRSMTHSRWFFELFGLLWHRGYFPETRYYSQHREMPVTPCRQDAARIAGRLAGPRDPSPEELDRVVRFLEENADGGGTVMEISDCRYGWTLWNVNDRQPRA